MMFPLILFVVAALTISIILMARYMNSKRKTLADLSELWQNTSNSQASKDNKAKPKKTRTKKTSTKKASKKKLVNGQLEEPEIVHDDLSEKDNADTKSNVIEQKDIVEEKGNRNQKKNVTQTKTTSIITETAKQETERQKSDATSGHSENISSTIQTPAEKHTSETHSKKTIAHEESKAKKSATKRNETKRENAVDSAAVSTAARPSNVTPKASGKQKEQEQGKKESPAKEQDKEQIKEPNRKQPKPTSAQEPVSNTTKAPEQEKQRKDSTEPVKSTEPSAQPATETPSGRPEASAAHLLTGGVEASAVNPQTDRIDFAVPIAAYDPATVHSIYRPQRKRERLSKRMALIERFCAEHNIEPTDETKDRLLNDFETLPDQEEAIPPPTQQVIHGFNVFTANWIIARNTADESAAIAQLSSDPAWSEFKEQHDAKQEEKASAAFADQKEALSVLTANQSTSAKKPVKQAN